MLNYKCLTISINAPDTTEYLGTKTNLASTILQSTKKVKVLDPLTLFRIGLFGASYRWEGAKSSLPPPPPKICHTYSTIMKLGTVIPYLKKTSKNISITWHTFWILLTSAFFHWKSVNFAISENTDIDCILVHNF